MENRGGETEATKEQLRFGNQRQRAATGANKTAAEGAAEITLLFTRADIRLDIEHPGIPLLDLLAARKQKNREDTPIKIESTFIPRRGESKP